MSHCKPILHPNTGPSAAAPIAYRHAQRVKHRHLGPLSCHVPTPSRHGISAASNGASSGQLGKPHQLESLEDPLASFDVVAAGGTDDGLPDVELLPVLDELVVQNGGDLSPAAPQVATLDEENPYTTQDALSTAAEGAGGEPELEALLAEGGEDLSVERLCRIFPFPLDSFQKKSVEHFLEGKSVVVCAPTGAGKTAIAEAATAATLARGQRVIYTTPLKALSNQKLFETRKRFGTQRCGLQTGDASLNTDADVVVMTTEILRNIMYRTAESSTPAAGEGADGSEASAGGDADDPASDFSLLDDDSSSGSSSSSRGGLPSSSFGGVANRAARRQAYVNSDDEDGWLPDGYTPTPSPATLAAEPGYIMANAVIGGGNGNSGVDEGSKGGSGASGGGGAGRGTREARLGNVGLVVLDEVHYLGDPHRGSVWEEVIINCPRHIQLLCMSATVKNPDELGAWITKEHGECVTIKTRFRPVPLHWQFSFNQPKTGVVLTDLLVNPGTSNMRLNPMLELKRMLQEEARLLLARNQRGGAGGGYSFNGGYNGNGRRGQPQRRYGGASSKEDSWDVLQLLDEGAENDPALVRKAYAKRVPFMESVILRLRQANVLPAIWFILSRKDCDLAAIKASAAGLNTPEERAAVEQEVAALRADQAEAVRENLVPALVDGIASHHAGHLPGWKALVERLFQRGLLKVVFATGTLAAGINMPARTTVVSALSRMTDEGPKPLPHNELLQMAGRAGRRGYDTEGYCVVLQNRFEGAEEAFRIIRAGPEPLLSQFSVSYGLVLNLLSVYTLEQAREFVGRSFGAFQQEEGGGAKRAEIKRLEWQARQLEAQFRATATRDMKKLNASLKAARERLQELRVQGMVQRATTAVATLEEMRLPRKAVLNIAPEDSAKPILMPALLLTKAPTRPDAIQNTAFETVPFYWALGSDNRLMRCCAVHIVGLLGGPEGRAEDADIGVVMEAMRAVKVAGWANVKAGQFTCQVALGTASTAVVAAKLQARSKWQMVPPPAELAKAVAKEQANIKATLQQLEDLRQFEGSAADMRGGNRESIEKQAKAKQLLQRADALRKELDAATGNTWRSFQDVIEVLIAMDALQPGTLQVLPMGLLARSLQGQNELWLALALSSRAIMALNGPELAALLGALLSAEAIRRPTPLWSAYSASDRVIQAVQELEPVRSLLQELQTEGGLSRWNEALQVDLRMAGVVEAWAAGATWAQIMQDSTLDDGDIARLLIRTIDMLKQIVYCRHLLPHLQDAAREALRGMDRKPVAELVF